MLKVTLETLKTLWEAVAFLLARPRARPRPRARLPARPLARSPPSSAPARACMYTYGTPLFIHMYISKQGFASWWFWAALATCAKPKASENLNAHCNLYLEVPGMRPGLPHAQGWHQVRDAKNPANKFGTQ